MKFIPDNLNLIYKGILTSAFLMIIFGFQLKYFSSANTNQIWDRLSVLLILLLIIKTSDKKLVVLFVAWGIISFLLGGIKQGLYDAIIFYFGYLLATRHKATILISIQILMVLNILIMLLQIAGISSLIYSFQKYNGDTFVLNSILSFDENSGVPLMQLRPSGIFPSTVYLSLFEFFLVGYFFTERVIARSQLVMLSLLFALSGSTASLMLVFLAVGFKNSKFSSELFFLYSFFILLYRTFLPRIFFEYNFSVADFLSSISGRFSNSYLNQFSVNNVLVVIFVALSLYLWFKNRKSQLEISNLIFIGILALGPLLIHDFSTVIFYWFHVGFLYGTFICKSVKTAN